MADYKYELKGVSYPRFHKELIPVELSDKTMKYRKEKVLALMRQRNLDVLAIYCDLEHGSNFEYLTGFLTRFEESILVFHQDGTAYFLAGNENTKMADHSRLPVICIHVPFFSLPNQPMKGEISLTSCFSLSGITKEKTVGIVGWKLFTSKIEDNDSLFDIPHYVVEALKHVAKEITNATDIFIHPDYGVRTINNANEIAHYEFGSSLASDGILRAMDAIQVGKTELEIAGLLNHFGQPTSVITICATGKRFEHANLYPSNKTIELGDRLSLTVGYKGGLSSRVGYVVENVSQLPIQEQDYLSKLGGPYFIAMASWLENIHIGMRGGEMYSLIETILPKDEFNWEWNPGHLTADEEWLSSPIYPGSSCVIKSGMLFQVDIIPSKPGYAGVSAECTIALADELLRNEIMQAYPQLWEVIQQRSQYIRKELGIHISKEVLPMSDTVAYWRPFLLNKEQAMVVLK